MPLTIVVDDDQDLQRTLHSFQKSTTDDDVRTQLRTYGLSEREREVLMFDHDGLSRSSIAQRLCISVHTVEFHWTTIYHKRGFTSREQARQWVATLYRQAPQALAALHEQAAGTS